MVLINDLVSASMYYVTFLILALVGVICLTVIIGIVLDVVDELSDSFTSVNAFYWFRLFCKKDFYKWIDAGRPVYVEYNKQWTPLDGDHLPDWRKKQLEKEKKRNSKKQ